MQGPPAPMRNQLLDLLRQNGQMTTAELARQTGKTTQAINSALCKAAMYGIVGKADGYETVTVSIRRKTAALNKWTLRE